MKIKNIPQAVLNACSNLEMSDAEIERSTPKELFAAYTLWEIVTKLHQHGGR